MDIPQVQLHIFPAFEEHHALQVKAWIDDVAAADEATYANGNECPFYVDFDAISDPNKYGFEYEYGVEGEDEEEDLIDLRSNHDEEEDLIDLRSHHEDEIDLGNQGRDPFISGGDYPSFIMPNCDDIWQDDSLACTGVIPEQWKAIEGPEGVEPCSTRAEVMDKIAHLVPSFLDPGNHTLAITEANEMLADDDFLLLPPMLRSIMYYCAIDADCERVIQAIAPLPAALEQVYRDQPGPLKISMPFTKTGADFRFMAWNLGDKNTHIKPWSDLGKRLRKLIRLATVVADINENEQNRIAAEIRQSALGLKIILLREYDTERGEDMPMMDVCNAMEVLRKAINDPYRDVGELLALVDSAVASMRAMGIVDDDLDIGHGVQI